jgi:hypothetical protein
MSDAGEEKDINLKDIGAQVSESVKTNIEKNIRPEETLPPESDSSDLKTTEKPEEPPTE